VKSLGAQLRTAFAALYWLGKFFPSRGVENVK